MIPVFHSVILTIVFCLLIILAGVYLAVRKFSWLVKNRGLLIFFIVVLGIAVYTTGYLMAEKPTDDPLPFIKAGLMAVFSTGRMFVLESDFSEFSLDVEQFPVYGIVFGAVMTLAMLTIVMVVLSLFGFGFLSSLRIQMLRLFGTRRTMYVFSCISDRTLALARDIRKSDRRSLMLFLFSCDNMDVEQDNRLLRKVAALDNTYIHVSAQEYLKLDDCGIYPSLAKAQVRFVALQDDLTQNMKLALKLAMLLKSDPVKDQVTIHVLTDELLFGCAFEAEDLAGINLVPLDKGSLASHELMDRMPIIHYARTQFRDGCAEGELTMLVIGLDRVSSFLCKDFITQGQMAGLRLRLILAGEHVDDFVARFLADNPEADRYATMEGRPVIPGSAQFFTWYKEHCQEADVIICAGESDEENARLIRMLRRIAQDAGVQALFGAYICTKDFSKYVFTCDPGCAILSFGDDSILERADIVINERLDHMAKAVHRYYCKIYSGGKPWQQLSMYERESSRALAMHIQTKLYALDMELTSRSKDRMQGGNPFDALITARPDVLENLAASEHMRWCAHLATHGWTRLPINEIYQNTDRVHKRHPCMTEWDDLGHISQVAGRNFQDLDRDLIRNLSAIAADGDMHIVQRG